MKKLYLLSSLITAIFLSSGCSDDDNPTPTNENVVAKEYKIQFWGYSSSEEQYPLTTNYYKDNQNGELATETTSSLTNTDVIESHTLTSFDKLGFKLTVGNGGQAPVNIVMITDMETNELIFENSSLEIDTGQTFMYDISSNQYTVQ